MVDGAQIIGERPDPILRDGRQTGIDKKVRGAGIGLEPAFRACADQGVGLFVTGAEDAPRAVLLEAAAHQADAVGQKRRGESVAGETLIGAPVEGEGDRLRAVDQSAAFVSVRPVHAAPPVRLEAGRASVMTWLKVSRVNTTQERQP